VSHQSVIALVRRNDPDRFLTALFTPAAKRDALLTLYAFNHELARAREVVSEPHLALIRLHWWREVVEGARRKHEIAEPLGEAIDAGLLAKPDLLAVIDARETEAEPELETTDDWLAWLLAGAGGLAVAAARLLGADDPEEARLWGAAYGVAGVLTSARMLAAQGRCLLPEEALKPHGLTTHGFIASPDSEPARTALAGLVAEGEELLAHRPRLPKQAIAAVLPGILARRDLKRWPRVVRPRGLGDRLAVTQAGLAGKL
jgi:15-cis-phytoene synthase